MIPLLGSTYKKTWVAELQRRGWGRMCVRDTPRPYAGEPWGFDNGAFVAWKQGQPFDEGAFMRRLDKAIAVGKPYLAVTPDIVTGGMKSLEYSMKWLVELPVDWPWYLAVQDGMTFQAVLDVLPHFEGVFLGGSDAFKLTARDWRNLAHRNGKRFHFARAGTVKKAEFAMRVGSDSLDSAFPLWTQARWDAFLRTMDGERSQTRILLCEEVTL